MSYTMLAPAWARYYTDTNVAKIGFTLHHATCLSLSAIAATFQSRQASAQWGVATGQVQQYVPENAYAWHAGHTWANTYTEGIECVNSTLAPNYDISESTIDTLVEFLADRARARGIGHLEHGVNVWGHKEFSATSCPGQLMGRIDEICNRVNKILSGGNPVRKKAKMQCFIQPNDASRIDYYDGVNIHPLANPDEIEAIQMVARNTVGHDLPCFKLGSDAAPWASRLYDAIERPMSRDGVPRF